jgi:hypothetical protein
MQAKRWKSDTVLNLLCEHRESILLEAEQLVFGKCSVLTSARQWLWSFLSLSRRMLAQYTASMKPLQLPSSSFPIHRSSLHSIIRLKASLDNPRKNVWLKEETRGVYFVGMQHRIVTWTIRGGISYCL